MTEIINRLNEMLINSFSTEEIRKIELSLRSILYEYEIQKKQTAIAVYKGDSNERLIKKFLATKMVQGCTERTIKNYSQSLHQFCKKAQKNLTEITTDDILYYLAIRATVDKVTATTQDNELRVLRTFYAYLHGEEIVLRNPTLKINKIRGQKKVKICFTETELEFMRNACKTRTGVNLKHLAILEILISTGCRATELATMKLENIDGERIRILGKGNKERWVYLNARASVALQNYLNERESNSSFVFPGETCCSRGNYISDHITGDSVNGIVKRIAKRAGIENAHAHKFRRTAATMALRRGMPIEMVSKMLGHEQLGTTQIYLQITDDELAAAHRKYC